MAGVEDTMGFDQASREVANSLARFEAARNLGMLAAGLEKQAENIYSDLDKLQLGEAVAPRGKFIRINTSNPEDPLTVEHKEGFADDPGEWVSLSATEYAEFDGRFGQGARETTTFFGKEIAYDKGERKVFVYSEDGSLRVHYRKGTHLSLADLSTHEREVSRLLRSYESENSQ